MVNGELIVDNFAGGGGASTGIEMATGSYIDIAINHDPEAVRMHKTNHPYTKHYCEDIWDVDPVKACRGQPVGLAWFSPDCKHFSKAKGGRPVEKGIRGLAWSVLKWAALVRPRVIMLENVEEFQTWGPCISMRDKKTGRVLVKDGGGIRAAGKGEVTDVRQQMFQPDIDRKGQTYRKWRKQLEDLGYEVDTRELAAADYGTPTTRKRFFMVARCDGRPIVWPEPTHAPRESEKVRSGLLKPYKGAYTQMDFSLPCPSIFDTAEEIKAKYGIRAVRPLAPKTMERIARGLKKFVLDKQEPFIVQGNHSRANAVYCNRRDGLNRCGLVASFLHKYYDGGYKGAGDTLENPLPTITPWDHNSIVTANLIQMNNHYDGKDITEPLPTITAGGGHFGEVRAFLIKYYGEGTGQDINEPLGTVTSRDRFGLVTIHGIDYQIVDIGLRMLEPREMYGCQGFPRNYVIDRDYNGKRYPRSEQVRRCGNSVCPPIPAALVRVNLPELCVGEGMPDLSIPVKRAVP